MASGRVNLHLKAEHTGAPTNAANVKKVLANSEPSTHGGKADIRKRSGNVPLMTQLGRRADAREAPHNSRLTMC